jgi:hypothetical protein
MATLLTEQNHQHRKGHSQTFCILSSFPYPQNISKHLKTLKTFELPTVFQYHHIFMYATLARITPLGPTSDAGNPTSEP